MNQSFLRRSGVVAAALFSILTAAANAALLTPNGNPSGGDPGPYAATFYQFSSVLYPTPAAFVAEGSCPWIIPALQAQGYTKANGWTITAQPLQGDLELRIYRPWVVLEPALAQGEFAFNKATRPDHGGAQIGIRYLPKDGSTDPTGAAVSWIQVIHTDDPSPFGKARGASEGNGFYSYLDNSIGTPFNTTLPNSPVYPGASNSTDFIDAPFRPLIESSTKSWQAQVFVANYAANNPIDRTQGGAITLYDGVWWGYSLAIPEPSTWALAVFGLVIFGIVGQQRKYRRA